MTNPTTPQQSDREAAWPHRPAFMTDTVATAKAWNEGRYDDQRIIQAFAHHAQQARLEGYAQGITEERERCARIADDISLAGHEGGATLVDATAEYIATTIRKGDAA